MAGWPFNIVFTDYTGGTADLGFLQDGEWLQDAAVIPFVYRKKGRWHIVMTFAWVAYPLRFICRYMADSFDTESKAALYAGFYQRTSQKDKRGTLTINSNDFTLCFN